MAFAILKKRLALRKVIAAAPIVLSDLRLDLHQTLLKDGATGARRLSIAHSSTVKGISGVVS